jgi:hypothetical protein
MVTIRRARRVEPTLVAAFAWRAFFVEVWMGGHHSAVVETDRAAIAPITTEHSIELFVDLELTREAPDTTGLSRVRPALAPGGRGPVRRRPAARVGSQRVVDHRVSIGARRPGGAAHVDGRHAATMPGGPGRTGVGLWPSWLVAPVLGPVPADCRCGWC